MNKIMILYNLLLLLFVSCRVNENYQLTDKTEVMLITDTIIIPSTHLHYEGEGRNNYCVYIEEMIYTYVDTLYIEVIEKNYLKQR